MRFMTLSNVRNIYKQVFDSSTYQDTCPYKTTCIGSKQNASKQGYGYFSIYNKFSFIVLRVTLVAWLLNANNPSPEGLHVSFYLLYNVVSENHNVQNSP